ncbi:MAG: hypothetical protein IJO90_01925 [Alistipes sp.]|nr:hypothetical protein [Alistipes sp.]MBQ9962104.1 hypothetical protein [Alistipes sp.]
MKKLISILAGLLCVACMTDYSGVSILEYQNNSSHDIQFTGRVYEKESKKIVDVKYSLPKSDVKLLELSANFTTSKNSKEVSNFAPYLVWNANDVVNICFDNSVVIPLSQTKCNDKFSCEYIENSRYRYTFTDADYQFALENGTKLEW